MSFFVDAFMWVQDVGALIRWGGYAALAFIVFAETGLFFGFFLPGDSLLVTAGLFAARGDLDIGVLLVLVPVCAIIGDAVGFEIGRFTGQTMFGRKDSLFFKKRHLEKTKAFYQKHGGKTIIFARFMPAVRSFAPLVAGMAAMPYRRFAFFNVTGGILWSVGLLGLGYGLGNLIPNIDEYVHFVIVIVIFLSVLPGIIGYLRERSRRST